MIEDMEIVGIADNIVNVFEYSKETLRTELTTFDESLGETDIRRGKLQ